MDDEIKVSGKSEQLLAKLLAAKLDRGERSNMAEPRGN